MARIDTKGRVTLPKAVREDLGLEPGTEVEVHDEDGRVVIEPERDPEDVIADLERMTGEIERVPGEGASLGEDLFARKHREAIRRGAERDG